MIVEDGTAPAGANSYASETAFDALVENHGLTQGSGDVEAALVRATAWIDGRYRARFPGTRQHGRDQALEWPRSNAVDRDGYEIAESSIPVEVVNATIHAALRELSSAGSLYPVTSGGAFVKRKREKIGSLEEETEYESPEPDVLHASEIDDILDPLINQSWFSGGGMVPLLRA